MAAFRSTSLKDLRVDFAARVGEGLRLCMTRGVLVRVYCTLRNAEAQQEEFDKGRRTPGPIVTQALPWQSAHQFGLAADMAPYVLLESSADMVKYNTKKLDWDPFEWRDGARVLDRAWQAMRDSFKAAGLEWAGDWTGGFKEYVHWQMPGIDLAKERERLGVVVGLV